MVVFYVMTKCSFVGPAKWKALGRIQMAELASQTAGVLLQTQYRPFQLRKDGILSSRETVRLS
jgi:hypothetical protein